MKLHLFSASLILFFSPPLFSEECAPEKSTTQEDEKEDDEEEDDEKDDDEKALKIGILAFPSSQQLSPLISFGQNIIDANEIQVGLFGDAYVGRHKHNIDAVPNLIWAITDNFSIYIEALDYAVSYRDGLNRSRGWEDTLVQLEYAYYNEETKLYVDQATFVAGLYLPTGSGTKVPNTGFGSPAIFLGSTFSRTGIYWYWFTSYGANLTFCQNGSKIGNQYLYQTGFGRYITTFCPNWLFCWMIEIDGQYSEHNKFRGFTDPNSGGSSLYITPSLWLANCDWRFQLGVGYAVQQHSFGQQNRLGWVYVFDVVYSIW